MDPIKVTPPILESTVERYGLLGGGLVIVALVLVYVFRLYLKTNETIGAVREAASKASEAASSSCAEERAAASLREEKMRAEFERKHTEIVERYARDLVEQARLAREEQAAIRREHDATLEAVAESNAASTTRHITTIEKLTDRIVQVPKERGRY